MPTGFIKAALLALTALIFGASQICACASGQIAGHHTLNADSGVIAVGPVTTHQKSASTQHHSAEPDSNVHSACHGKTSQHCDEGVHAAITPDSVKLSAMQPGEHQPIPILRGGVSLPRAFPAPNTLAGLRWPGPPRRAATPVSLKIRLLN